MMPLSSRPKKTHTLKISPCYFRAVSCGDKPFEVRLNDRQFHTGDTLQLREWEADAGYSGNMCRARITYVLDAPEYLQPGYVVLGLALLPPPRPVSHKVLARRGPWPGNLHNAVSLDGQDAEMPDWFEERVSVAMVVLTDLERTVLLSVYRDHQRQKDVAQTLDIRPQRVHQVESKALRKLRRALFQMASLVRERPETL